ncbi:pyruvate dehydrogenase complex dihydrolipoamide acetyltransferase [Saprospiraceae bacterium]|nr:pyruvate dehydrogenase complex dihydrolipoamide acetyltransferase [Saprospiraceae bacterium]
MAEVIRMPRMSDTMEEGNIVGWLAKVGDVVAPGDVLAEVETDKATMELESFHDGVLLYIGVKEGPIAVDGILAVIGEKGEDFMAAIAAEEKSNPAEAPKSEDAAPSNAPVSAPAPAAEEPVAQSAPVSDSRVKASPLAKSIAKEAGIDISAVTGSGDNGRVIKKDVESFIANGPAASAGSSAPVSKESLRVESDFQYGDVPVSQMRKVIARRLGESKFSAPHFYLTIEIDMDNAMKARKEINDGGDVRISFNDLVVKAAAMSLRKHPTINSSWHGDKITYHRDIHVGVAVAVPDGLLVPVVRDTDLKSLSMINQEVRALAGKAKEKRLTPEQMSGNTFTISNLGMFGIDEFTAIINPPDACIMAVGSIFQKPVVKNGEIVVGNVMKVTLSCDHRVVDGVSGAKFLDTFRSMLEQPLRLVV